MLLKVLVATKSAVKVQATREAFERFFPEREIEVTPIDVPSGVPRQPVDDWTLVGAQNRLQGLKDLQLQYNYIVAIEGGLFFDERENCCMNQHIVLIEERSGMRRQGLSPAYEVPAPVAKRAIEVGLSHAIDEGFQGKGGVRVITNNTFTRKDLIYQGVVMALAGFCW